MHFDDSIRITYVMIGKLAHVDEAVLMDADIHEGAECRHVRNDARQLHAGREIFELFDPLGEGKLLK
ncbi:MAG: hypothetical protein BWY96_02471 [Spirochaetes bacterium ADurb.BinA120]|nr:MAG: hypothetical protein BWY96_02471 [Spirochaetes bacterium ADurb.BinA120]